MPCQKPASCLLQLCHSFSTALLLAMTILCTGPFAWGRGSCLELIFSRDAWRDAWLKAESEDAQEQLQDILDRLNAWDASPSVQHAAAFGHLPQNGTTRYVVLMPTCIQNCTCYQAGLSLLGPCTNVLRGLDLIWSGSWSQSYASMLSQLAESATTWKHHTQNNVT